MIETFEKLQAKLHERAQKAALDFSPDNVHEAYDVVLEIDGRRYTIPFNADVYQDLVRLTVNQIRNEQELY